MRLWLAAKPGYASEQARKHRATAREYERARYQNDAAFRERKKARNAVLIRISRGTLRRGECEVCGAENAQAHHEDYSRPLDVRWLCELHHRQHHGELGQLAA